MPPAPEQSPRPAAPGPQVLWMLWLGIASSIFAVGQLFLGGLPRPHFGAPIEWSPFLAISVTLLVVSLFIRVRILPRYRRSKSYLVAMVIGLALGEAPVYQAIFLISDANTGAWIYWLSALLVFSYAPTGAHRSPAA